MKTKNKLVHNRSSYLVIWPLIAAMFSACILSFIFRSYFLSLIFLVVGMVMAAARIWSGQASKGLRFSARPAAMGVFPGEQIIFHLETSNEKLLPVMCAEAYFPLTKDLCMTPEETRPVEEYEKACLEEQDASLEKVGEKSLPTLLWYETRTVRSFWSANRRGLYSTAGWKLRTGDGFGLSQMEIPVNREDVRLLAVYPELVPVDTTLFLRMAWSADTGARGVMEDQTVIRSSREYLPGDPVKHMNWRLLARGLPLSVNVYEEILPQSAYFIFDGESFSGREKHSEEMEDALSILASVILAMEGKVRSGISFSENGRGIRKSLEIGADTEEILWAFSGYFPKADVMDEDNKTVDQEPVFDVGAIVEESEAAGHLYYVTYRADQLRGQTLLSCLDKDRVTILSYVDAAPFRDYETLSLQGLRVGQPADPRLTDQRKAEQQKAGHLTADGLSRERTAEAAMQVKEGCR